MTPLTRPSSGLTEEDLRPPHDFVEEQKVASAGDWISDFIPDDNAPPHKMRAWRKRLALVACSNWMFTFFLMVPALVALLFVGVPFAGADQRVIFTSELNSKIDARLDAKLAESAKEQREMKADIKKLTDAKDLQGAMLLSIVIPSLRAEICGLAAKRLLETKYDERNRLLTDIKDRMEKYKLYSGQEFNTADC